MTNELNNKVFRSLQNTENGDVTGETIFKYTLKKNIVSVFYSGGDILFGQMLGKIINPNQLELRYQHLSRDHAFKTGICFTTLSKDDMDRIILHEKWKWTCGDFSSGESLVREIK